MEVPGGRGIRQIPDDVLNQRDLNPSLFYAKFAAWKVGETPDKEKHIERMIKLGSWPPNLSDLARYLHKGAHRTFSMKTATRLLIGRANPSVFEQGIAIHPLWGFPFLAGSSVKGAVRHWAMETEKDETLIRTIFGSEPDTDTDKSKGQIVFFDAIPLQSNCLEKEVFAPHYPNYYSGKADLPSDAEKPNIFLLPAVKRGINFKFSIKLSMKTAESSEGKDILKHAETWIKSALIEFGIGSKTSSSYGYFE